MELILQNQKLILKKLLAKKESIIGKLTGGLAALAAQRKVKITTGYGKFTSDKSIEVVNGSKNASKI